MDRQYAELSALAGMLAGAADAWLGKPHFADKVREKAWELTPEYVQRMREEAIGMGVPAEKLPTSLEPRDEPMLAAMMIAQAMSDKKHLH